MFWKSDINYLAEGAFKSILDNKNSSIILSTPATELHSSIDCEDCRNLWLIKENKQSQIRNANCKGGYNRTLFHEDIKSKLIKKCK